MDYTDNEKVQELIKSFKETLNDEEHGVYCMEITILSMIDDLLRKDNMDSNEALGHLNCLMNAVICMGALHGFTGKQMISNCYDAIVLDKIF